MVEVKDAGESGPTGRQGPLVNANGQHVTIRANEQAFRKLKEVCGHACRHNELLLCTISYHVYLNMIYVRVHFVLILPPPLTHASLSLEFMYHSFA